MAYFGQDFIDEVLDRNDIVDVISSYVTLKKKGNSFWGLCPFHGEKTPSFSVNPTQQYFHCFGCHVGGDVINFVKKIEKLDFSEAVIMLAERARIPIPENKSKEPTISSDEKTKMYGLMTEAARWYYTNLDKELGANAKEYLVKRGISPAIRKRFGLGYAPDEWNALKDYLHDKGADDKMLQSIGLANSKNDRYYDAFRNRIMFPIIDKRGRVIAFGGRVMDDSMPKYLNSPDTPIFNKRYNLYGINLIHKQKNVSDIILVEGYMDVISMHQSGLNNAVASLGTAFTQNQAKLIKRYSNDVYICYDGDKAGRAATDKALDVLYSVGISPKVISLPIGVDPDDYVKKHGLIGFEDKKQEAKPIFDYKISTIKSKYKLDVHEERKQFLEQCCREVLAIINSPIEYSMYVDILHNLTGVSKVAIEAETDIAKKALGKMNELHLKSYNIVDESNTKSKESLEHSHQNNHSHIRAERILLELAIIDVKSRQYLKDRVQAEMFSNPARVEIAKKIFLLGDEQITIGKFMSLVNTSCYTELGAENIQNTPENLQVASECISTMKLAALKQQRQELIMKIESKAIDNNQRIEYINKLQKIDNKIKNPTQKGEV